MLISQLSLGKKVYISSNIDSEGNDINNFYEYVSQIVDIINEKEFVISTPLLKGDSIDFKAGDEVKVGFTHENGLFVLEGEIRDVVNENGLMFYRVYVISDIKRLQRREHFRVLIHLPIIYKIVRENKDLYGQGLTKDISGGGLKFVCSDEIEVGETVNIFLKLNSNIELKAIGEVIRRNLIEARKYEISLVFVDLDFSQRESLIKQIFEIQRDYLKRK